MRGVAAAIIGEDRVFAIGISFFLSQQPRPQQSHLLERSFGFSSDTMIKCCSLGDSADNSIGSMETYTSAVKYDRSPTLSMNCSMPIACAALPNESHSRLMHSAREVKKLEVAAGAKIDQRIYDDPNNLDFWQKEPEGLVVINYCTEEDAKRIIEAGKVDVKGSPEGFLTGVPVGNT